MAAALQRAVNPAVTCGGAAVPCVRASSAARSLHPARSLLLAPLLVAAVGSRVPVGHRVSDGGAALDAAGAAWMLAAAREWRPVSVG